MILFSAIVLISLCALGYHAVKSFRDSILYHRHLPPGPPRKPIIGNLRDLPPSGCHEWLHWVKHKDLYGPISSVTTMGQTIVILNKAEIAYELLQRRASKYSSRPHAIFSIELAGWDRIVTLNGDAATVRAHRKYITQLIGTQHAVTPLHSMLDVAARHFLLHMLQRPKDLVNNVHRVTGASILEMVYGYKAEPSGRDHLVELVDLSASQFSQAAQPGTWAVDALPILKYLPSWFPGGGFHRTAREWSHVLFTMAEKPYAFVQHHRKLGTNKPSYVSKHLDELGKNITPEQENLIKWTATILYGGGVDTTASTILTFFLAMTLYPDAQRRAQEEIDRVIGSGGGARLPTLEDRGNLPYVNALIQEVLRWHPVAPLAVPHTTTEADEYDGYWIPKGAMIIANIWAFTHDPDIYSDPMSFNPDRFLVSKEGEHHEPEWDPYQLVFGFGRRICPGQAFADATVFLTIVKTLAVFNITKDVDKLGSEVTPSINYSPGLIAYPAPFPSQIHLRSVNAEKLIQAVDIEHPWTEGDSKVFNDIKFEAMP